MRSVTLGDVLHDGKEGPGKLRDRRGVLQPSSMLDPDYHPLRGSVGAAFSPGAVGVWQILGSERVDADSYIVRSV